MKSRTQNNRSDNRLNERSDARYYGGSREREEDEYQDDDFFDYEENDYDDRYSPHELEDDFEDYSNNYDDDDEFERLTHGGRRGFENLGRNYEQGRLNEGRADSSNRPLRHSSSGHEIGSGFAARGGDKARRFASLGGKTSHVSEWKPGNANRNANRRSSGRNRY